MKRYLIILFCFLGSASIAQQSAIDSLLRVAGKSTGTDQVDLLNAVAYKYLAYQPLKGQHLSTWATLNFARAIMRLPSSMERKR
jgi:hypothetical protein